MKKSFDGKSKDAVDLKFFFATGKYPSSNGKLAFENLAKAIAANAGGGSILTYSDISWRDSEFYVVLTLDSSGDECKRNIALTDFIDVFLSDKTNNNGTRETNVGLCDIDVK